MAPTAINVQLDRDKYTCTISDICQLPDGRILLTDEENENVKMLDVNYNVIDSCELYSAPTEICCVSRNEIAVKTVNNKVQFISVVSYLSKTRCISIKRGGFYGMVYFN
jgi:hypothetical protein